MSATDNAVAHPPQIAGSGLDAPNRRQQLRHLDPWFLKVALRELEAPGSEIVEAQISDFSARGCGLRVSRNVDAGRSVEVLIEIPASGESFILGGVIRWCGQADHESSATSAGECRAGVEFSDRSRPDFARWERFVSRAVAFED